MKSPAAARAGLLRLALLAACLLGAGLCGCADLHPAAPSADLAQRILSSQPVALPVPPEPAPDNPVCPAGALTLGDALALADQNNPGLLQMLARVEAARAGREVAFADFLPEANVTFRHIQGSTGKQPFALPTLPTYVGNVAFGGTSDSFDTAELHIQWTLFDFGRTLGKFGQATAAADIAELQYERARQTVAFSVTAAYLAVLRARAERRIAEEAVRRAEPLLRDARNFLRRGTGIPNEVLRTEVLLTEARMQLIQARTAEGVAAANLVQEIGLNKPLRLADAAPALGVCRLVPGAPLPDVLQAAVEGRPEFRAALQSIVSARLGEGVAKADFLPKVVSGATAAFQEIKDKPDAELLTGGIGIELGLFEGKRRMGRLRGARAEVSLAVAQGQEICDRIAFEATAAHLRLTDARERIVLARTEVSHATENLRVVRKLFEKGDATPTDVADADLALVRAQENEVIALYDYLTAVARLAYAVGLPAEPGTWAAELQDPPAPEDRPAEKE